MGRVQSIVVTTYLWKKGPEMAASQEVDQDLLPIGIESFSFSAIFGRGLTKKALAGGREGRGMTLISLPTRTLLFRLLSGPT